MRQTFLCVCMMLMMLCVSMNAKAQTVSPEDAKAKAKAFLSVGAKKLPARKGVKRVAPRVSNIELAYTSEKEGKPCFYVFNNGTDDGFVIVGGDEAAKEILAYSDKGHFDYDKAPDNFKNMLEQYAEQISLAKQAAKEQTPKTLTDAPGDAVIQKEDVADLIETTWGQNDPYNRVIPKLVSNIDGSEYAPPTGCVPTAIAQVMKYWNYPEHGIGQKRYILDYSKIHGPSAGDPSITPEFGTMVHDINFESTTYDWANMLNHYTGEESAEQINAVSTLMYHLGVACDAIYGPNQTGAGGEVYEVLKSYFGYSDKTEQINRDNYDDQTWEEFIYSEVKLGRPVIYEGRTVDGIGHLYVIHGYSSEHDMYKVNWGWGGSWDCYCKLTPINGYSGSLLMGFDQEQFATIGIQPATRESGSTPNYKDTFWENGLKYSIISSVVNTVEVARPDTTENQYAGTITIPSNVSHLGKDYSVISIAERAFSPYPYDGISAINPYESPVQEVILSNKLRLIRSEAFKYCANLESIILPNSVVKTFFRTFDNCYNLKSVTLSDRIEVFGSEFNSCYNLEFLQLPVSLKKLGSLSQCSNLSVLVSKASTPPALLNENPFPASARAGYLLVPKESINSYKNSLHWKDWEHILPLEDTDISMIGKTVSQDGVEYKIMPSGAEVINVPKNISKITIPDIIIANNKEYNVESIGPEAVYGGICDTIVLPQYMSTIKSRAFYYCHPKAIILPQNLKSIGSNAFFNCPNLEKICFPDYIEEIPENCFNNCQKLYWIELPRYLKRISNNAFGGCKNVYTVICNSEEPPLNNDKGGCRLEGTLYVPNTSLQKYSSSESWKDWRFIKPISSIVDEKLIEIEDNGFRYRLLNHGAVVMGYDYDPENLSIPETVEYEGKSYQIVSIGYHRSSLLSSVSLPSSLHSISNGAFSYCTQLREINIPSCKIIDDGVFWGCENLTSITLPDDLVSIEDNAFLGCSSLTSVNIPNSVTSIGDHAFGSCTGLTSVTIPESVTNIGTQICGGCKSLTSATILSPSTGDQTFAWCENLTSVTFGNSVTNIESGAFVGCSGLTSVTIPNSVTSIGSDVFSYCSSLTSVTIPNSVTSLEDGAFNMCTSLTSIEIPRSVMSIGDQAFYGCIGLTSLVIPNSVKSIGDQAFSGCSNLDLTLKRINCTIGSYNLNYVKSVKVPVGTGDAYKAAAHWSVESKISESREAGALLDEAATTSVVPAAAGDNVDVTLKRSFKAGDWNTLSLPFSMTAEQVQSVFGAGTKLATLTGQSGSTVYFDNNATTITANEPVLIKPTDISGTYFIEGATVVDCEPSATGVGASLIGNYEPLSGDQGVGTYYLSSGTFYQTQYMTSMKPFRAYLKLNGASSKNFYIGFNAPTGIFDVKANTSDDNAPVYNLEGQRVNGNTKGIVIKNGKKFINK